MANNIHTTAMDAASHTVPPRSRSPGQPNPIGDDDNGDNGQPSGSTSASVRFHSIPDIVADICEYLACDDAYDNVLDSDDLWSSRASLAALARTCKAYHEPALDRLWRSLNTLYPLLKILPAFVNAPANNNPNGTHVLRGTVSQEEWARFDFYARKVKKFCYVPDPPNFDIAMHVYFRVAQLHTAPLLPCLRHLSCPNIADHDFLISGVCLFLSPSLQSVEFGNISSSEDKLTGTLLHQLYLDGAKIESIVLKGLGLMEGTLDLVIPFQSLRSLEIQGMGRSIQLPWLKQLGANPKLEELALDFTNSPLLAEPPQEDLGFTKLNSLMITAPLSFTSTILPHINAPTLEAIVAVTVQDSSSERSTFISYVVDRWAITLRSFAMVHLVGDELSMELELRDLSGLYPLRGLREFRLEGYTTNITDTDVETFSYSWPNLTKLLLPYVSQDRTRPTYKALETLKERCPNLRHLRIPVDIARIPPFTFTRPIPLSTATTSKPSTPDASSSPPESSPELSTTSPSNPTTYSRYPRMHPLQRLVIATTDDLDTSEERIADSRNLIHLARHLDHLFPRLHYVTAFEGRDEDRWAHLHDMVQAFQSVRSETLTNQLYNPIG